MTSSEPPPLHVGVLPVYIEAVPISNRKSAMAAVSKPGEPDSALLEDDSLRLDRDVVLASWDANAEAAGAPRSIARW